MRPRGRTKPGTKQRTKSSTNQEESAEPGHKAERKTLPLMNQEPTRAPLFFRACSKGPVVCHLTFFFVFSCWRQLTLTRHAICHPTGHLKRVARLPKCSLWLPMQDQEGSRLPNTVPGFPLDMNKKVWTQANTKRCTGCINAVPVCGCLQDSLCNLSDDPGAHGDGMNTGANANKG